MENQMYLAPSQVEELRKLEVEFENSTDIWSRQVTDWQGKEPKGCMREWKRVRNNAIITQGMATYEDLPAPSIQEVLDKLPKVIEVFYDEECSDLYYLTLSHICSDYWSVYYLKNSYKIEHLANYSNENPLFAAYELLLWVAKTYPDCLIDKTEL